MSLCLQNIKRKIYPYVFMSSKHQKKNMSLCLYVFKTSKEKYVPMSLCLQNINKKNMFLYLLSLCLHVEQTVFHVDRAVGNRRQFLVMCHNHESLSEAIAQIEEKLVQFSLIL